MSTFDWSGKVGAGLEKAQATELHLKKGDVISVLATGWVKYGPNEVQWADPQCAMPRDGSGPKRDPPTALLAKIGGTSYPVGNGLLHWEVPAEGELVLLFSDVPGKYGDNSGSYDVKIKKEANGSATDIAAKWTGEVDSEAPAGQPTGITLNKGDVITVVASGWASRAPGKGFKFGPQGDPDTPTKDLICSEAYVGAVVAKIGGQYFPINSGVLHWQVPSAGQISFFFNDQPANYGDNTGSFKVNLEVLRPVP
ncbi:MAG TPA: LecA/PA-IL family lectin [Acetobacteraceae bacterium]|nr:LecA/PA-IL family lectin [Acetobacteraceae bacterium]